MVNSTVQKPRPRPRPLPRPPPFGPSPPRLPDRLERKLHEHGLQPLRAAAAAAAPPAGGAHHALVLGAEGPVAPQPTQEGLGLAAKALRVPACWGWLGLVGVAWGQLGRIGGRGEGGSGMEEQPPRTRSTHASSLEPQPNPPRPPPFAIPHISANWLIRKAQPSDALPKATLPATGSNMSPASSSAPPGAALAVAAAAPAPAAAEPSAAALVLASSSLQQGCCTSS